MKESLKLALKYDPGDPWAVHWMGALHYYREEFVEAFAALLRTRDMIGNPYSGFLNTQLFHLELNTLHIMIAGKHLSIYI